MADADWTDTVRFDALFVGLSILLMVGLAWDFRVHAGGISFAEEGFWTLPHVIVYGGGFGITVLLGGATVNARARGDGWIDAVPTGYKLGVVGLGLFAVSGMADSVWHTVISHEDTALESLTSPSHLGLATGGALFLSSPLRAAWRRDDPASIELLPAILSLSFVLSILVVFVAYANPLTATQILSDPYLGPYLALAGMLVFPAILLSASLSLVGRFELPPGGLTLLFLIPGAVSVGTNGHLELLLPVLAAGIVADLFVARWPPRPANPRALRLFGGCVPAVFAGIFFAVVETWHGLPRVWTIHLWTGAIVIAGLSGVLVTYAIHPDCRRNGTP